MTVSSANITVGLPSLVDISAVYKRYSRGSSTLPGDLPP